MHHIIFYTVPVIFIVHYIFIITVVTKFSEDRTEGYGVYRIDHVTCPTSNRFLMRSPIAIFVALKINYDS